MSHKITLNNTSSRFNWAYAHTLTAQHRSKNYRGLQKARKRDYFFFTSKMAINACNQFLSVYAVLWASFIWNVKGLKCTPITYTDTHSYREAFDRKRMHIRYHKWNAICFFLFSIHFNFKSLRSTHSLCTNHQLNFVSATLYIRKKFYNKIFGR